MLSALLLAGALGSPSSWPGVDEAVVEKVAAEAGRHARRPFIDTDRGDLLLFVFLSAGIVGGFALGYSYRQLFVERVGERAGAKE